MEHSNRKWIPEGIPASEGGIVELRLHVCVLLFDMRGFKLDTASKRVREM